MNIYFLEQAKLHPSMQMQDVIKFCYQAAFGAEHLLSDISRAEKYLRSEMDETVAHDGLLAEPISDDFCRVNLAVWQYRGFGASDLLPLFIRTASEKHGSEAAFRSLLAELIDTVPYAGLPFDREAFEHYAQRYLEGGIRAVHHSDLYREKERPAYRLILRSLIEPYERNKG